MNTFGFYVGFGWDHIISWDALDHQLFLTALMALYLSDQWKKVLILVTAFTLGHSLTLALSILDWIQIDSDWVEFLIPLTIVATCLLNLLRPKPDRSQRIVQYVLATVFGLIHGLGFANNIRFIMAKGDNFAINLLGFNLGLEAGQAAIVSLLLAAGYLVVEKIKLPQRYWSIFLTAAALCVALWITLQRIPSL